MYARIGIKNKRGDIFVSPSVFERTTRGFYLNIYDTALPAPTEDEATLFVEMQAYDRVAKQKQILKPVLCVGVKPANYHGGHEELFFDKDNPKSIPYAKVQNFHIENLILSFGKESAAETTTETPKLHNSILWHAASLINDPKRHAEMWAKMEGDTYEAKLWAYLCSEMSNGSCQATGWTPDPLFVKAAVAFKETHGLPDTSDPVKDGLKWLKNYDEEMTQ